MADHDDDKVSDNRRRLFKALSAAPVVMTLRPGEALANTSAFQCLVTAREDPGFDPGPVDQAFADASPYKYVGPFDYWIIPPNTCDPAFPAQKFVVRVASTGTDLFYNEQGTLLDPSDVDFTLRSSDEDLIYPATGQACINAEKIPDGYFAIIGQASQNDTFFEETGIYPVTGTGDYQGITGTCMMSLVNAHRYTPLL
jgi:hypothetical protein